MCSQSSASVLEDGPWRTLLSDLRNEGQTLLRRYTVEWVKRKAAAKQLVGQKVPFLAAVLHSIDCSSPDPCVVLRDATGMTLTHVVFIINNLFRFILQDCFMVSFF